MPSRGKREFSTGANRNSAEGKLEHDGFNSAIVDLEYAKYMHKHRFLEDGTMRDSDNWKKGFPLDVIVKSMGRHYMDFRLITERYQVMEDGKEHDMIDALMGLRFNINAMLHEILKEKKVINRNYE
tara:strand:- start:1603 stop:1980 length:378 start_codon:yes stop_codon:yes gene_type:complete